jgi:hypothetical protein
MCTLKLQFTILNIQVRSDRPALLPCRIRLVCYAQDELLHLLELLLKYKENLTGVHYNIVTMAWTVSHETSHIIG